jgi:hypothetical protein
VKALDDLLPAYEFADRVSTATTASPEAALRAAREVTAAEIPASFAMIALRAVPLMIVRRRLIVPREPVWDTMVSTEGFNAFADAPGQPLLMGYIGRPWRLAGGGVAVRSRAEFTTWEEPGWAKVALGFWAEEHGSGTRLATETRIGLTDASARRSFARYWRLVHSGSVLIRRDWLRAAKRRAER